LALIEKQISLERLEPGIGAWCTPFFPVPKKKPGEWRLVRYFCSLNEVTITDPYPLPRIDDIFATSRAVLHLVGIGYEGWVPPNPPGPRAQKIYVHGHAQKDVPKEGVCHGLKNGNAIFQRVMEWVLLDLPFADPYVDYIIVGSKGETEEEALANHDRDVNRVLEVLNENVLVCDPNTPQFLCEKLNFAATFCAMGLGAHPLESFWLFKNGKGPRWSLSCLGFWG
jgi:putative transposase